MLESLLCTFAAELWCTDTAIRLFLTERVHKVFDGWTRLESKCNDQNMYEIPLEGPTVLYWAILLYRLVDSLWHLWVHTRMRVTAT